MATRSPGRRRVLRPRDSVYCRACRGSRSHLAGRARVRPPRGGAGPRTTSDPDAPGAPYRLSPRTIGRARRARLGRTGRAEFRPGHRHSGRGRSALVRCRRTTIGSGRDGGGADAARGSGTHRYGVRPRHAGGSPVDARARRCRLTAARRHGGPRVAWVFKRPDRCRYVIETCRQPRGKDALMYSAGLTIGGEARLGFRPGRRIGGWSERCRCHTATP